MRKKSYDFPLNTLKHGAFLEKIAFLPGEDQSAFQLLHSDLVREWKPDGPTERDAVFTIAKCLWRKSRAQNYLEITIFDRAFVYGSPAYDEPRLLRLVVETTPEQFGFFLAFLSPENAQHLKNNFLPGNFSSPEEWKTALRKEISSTLLPKLECKPGELLLINSADVLGEELFRQELYVEERLDAMIDRAVKRLVQARALKQIIASPSFNGQTQQPKRAQITEPA